MFSGSVTQSNIFGSGKFVSATVSTSKVNRTYALSYLNPYFTIDGVSQGFDIYSRRIDASSLSVGKYKTDTLGGGLKFGYPLNETDSLSYGVIAENVKLSLYNDSPTQFIEFEQDFGDRYKYLAGSMGWLRDRRDSAIVPTSGTLTRAGGELAGGDLKYYRLNLFHQWLYPLSPHHDARAAGGFRLCRRLP